MKQKNLTGIKNGTNVTFTALRLTKGNPVKGKLKSEDEEWISVELAHDIEGLVNIWYAGETRMFRKSLINGLKVSQ